MCLVYGLIHPQIVSVREEDRSRARYAANAATRGSQFGAEDEKSKEKIYITTTKRIESNIKQNNDDGRPNKIHFNILLRDLYM